MAVLDFGLNRFSVTVSGGSVSDHAPTTSDGGRAGSVADTPVLDKTADWGPNSFTATFSNATVSAGQHAPVRFSLGTIRFGGRLYTSTYVPPTPTWVSKVIIVM